MVSGPAGDAESTGRAGLGTIRNAVTLLELLAEGPAYQQLTELAERSGMSIATVHRLLRSLVVADLVVQDSHTSRYGLGPEATRLSSHYLGRLPVLGALGPYLAPLGRAVGTTVHVQVLVRGESVSVDRVDSPEHGPYREIARVHPATRTAAGRLLAARAPDPAWEAAMERITPEDRGTCEDARADWARADHLVTDAPDAVTAGEVAVPVLDGQGRAVAALSADLTGPAGPERVAELVAHLTRAASAAGRTLGHV